VLQYVDPLIGTGGPGHVFGGSSLPYAMVKAVADTTSNNRGGFASDHGEMVTGFSHMHDTGIGGGSAMGNHPLFPMLPCKGNVPDGCAPFNKRARALSYVNESLLASPGYFSLELSNGIRTEMTSTEHTALYRFTYPNLENTSNTSYPTLNQMFILADLTDLYDSKVKGYIEVDHQTGRIRGNSNCMSSFGNGGRYDSYFCADFGGVPLISAGIWSQDETLPNKSNYSVNSNVDAGAYVQFYRPYNTSQVLARVGVSMISMDQACNNAESELENFLDDTFEFTVRQQEIAWDDKLDVIKVDATGVDNDLQTSFWSGIYRNFISPQNYTNENPLWKEPRPYFDSFYCIWDSFRVQFPLLTIIDPIALSQMINSLVDIYDHEGYLPDCRMQFDKGIVQGGSNTDVVIGDWAVKMGLTPEIDWNKTYSGLIKDAEVPSMTYLVEGRGHLNSYHKYGYIPQDDDMDGYARGLRGAQISRTVEYAYDDYCIARVSKLLNKTSDYDKYMTRAGNWRNMFKHDQKSILNGNDTSFVGFLQPKQMNGSWLEQEPSRGSPANSENCCGMFSQDLATYEGSCWGYTLYAPAHGSDLVKLLGGDDEFVRRLDFMHENELHDIGNEPVFLSIFQYHYAGRPGRSTFRTHYFIPSVFNSSRNGIPGNDDSGAMGAYVVFSMIGLFPVAGQNVYLITAPFFKAVSITNPITGNIARIITHNWDAEYKNIYIQRAKLNGRRLTRSWLDHSFFLDGGVLELWLGSKEDRRPTGWGVAEKDRPPSVVLPPQNLTNHVSEDIKPVTGIEIDDESVITKQESKHVFENQKSETVIEITGGSMNTKQESGHASEHVKPMTGVEIEEELENAKQETMTVAETDAAVKNEEDDDERLET